MHQRTPVDVVDADKFLQENLDASRALAMRVRARVHGAVVDIVIEQAGGTRRTAGDQGRQAGNRVGETRRVRVGVVQAVPRQLGEVRTGVGRDAVRQVLLMHAVNADQQHMFNRRMLAFGIRRRAYQHCQS